MSSRMGLKSGGIVISDLLTFTVFGECVCLIVSDTQEDLRVVSVLWSREDLFRFQRDKFGPTSYSGSVYFICRRGNQTDIPVIFESEVLDLDEGKVELFRITRKWSFGSSSNPPFSSPTRTQIRFYTY